MKVVKIFLLLLLGVSFTANGQDAAFSQYYSSELYLNPAMAGAESNITFSSNYRQQWRSIVLPYVTSQVSMIYPFIAPLNKNERRWGGMGLSFYNDKAGDGNFKTLGINGTFAYNLVLSKDGLKNLSFGIQGGIVQKNVDYTNLEWGEQYNPFVGFDATINPNEPIIGSGAFYPDFNAGILYYASSGKTGVDKRAGYFGVSAYHLNTPNESFVDGVVSNLPMLYKAHAGMLIGMSPKLSLSPNVLGMYQGEVYHVNGGLYLNYNAFGSGANPLVAGSTISFGTWYRYRDSFIFTIGLDNPKYAIGFSYDLNTSSLRHNTRGRGAYEVSLIIRVVKERNLISIESPRH